MAITETFKVNVVITGTMIVKAKSYEEVDVNSVSLDIIL